MPKPISPVHTRIKPKSSVKKGNASNLSLRPLATLKEQEAYKAQLRVELDKIMSDELTHLPMKERFRAFTSITNLKAGRKAAAKKMNKLRNKSNARRLFETVAFIWELFHCVSHAFDAIILNSEYACESDVGEAFVKGVFKSHA